MCARCAIVTASVVVVMGATTVGAGEGALLLEPATDTVEIPVTRGESPLSRAATYEARVLMSTLMAGRGFILREWQFVYMDRSLSAGPNVLVAHSAGLSPGGEIRYSQTGLLQPGRWHHLAYVYDGSEERLYVDGVRVAQRSAGGMINRRNPNSDAPFAMAIGAAPEGATGRQLSPGFRGHIDWVRISNVARYTDDFCPPASISADGATMLLYQFNDPPTNSHATDSSGRNRHGLLGFGIAPGETRPDFVPLPPGTFQLRPGDANCDGEINVADINCFVAALAGEQLWDDCGHAAGCQFVCQNDLDGNGAVGVGDINGFVSCLTGACP